MENNKEVDLMFSWKNIVRGLNLNGILAIVDSLFLEQESKWATSWLTAWSHQYDDSWQNFGWFF